MVTRTRKVRASKKPLPSSNGVVIPFDPIEPPGSLLDYSILLFGAKGVGKTSLASQFPGSIVCQLEPRRRNLRIRQYEIRPMSIKKLDIAGIKASPWSKIKEFVKAALEDKTVKHITIDTVDRFYDAAFVHHCVLGSVENPSMCNDYGQTWDKIRWDAEETLNSILYSGKGCMLTSHTKLRENEEDEQGTEFYAPTCKPAMWTICKAAADYAFFYGYLGSKRVLRMRGNEERYWLACGPEDHLLNAKKPIEIISMGKSAKEGYENLMLAFDNKLDPKKIIQ